MVTIATYGDGLEANLARGYLESAGIPAFLADELTMNTAWHLAVAVGGVKLQVNEPDATAAVRMLAERRTPIADEADGGAADVEETDAVLRYESSTDGADVETEPTKREQNADRAW